MTRAFVFVALLATGCATKSAPAPSAAEPAPAEEPAPTGEPTPTSAPVSIEQESRDDEDGAADEAGLSSGALAQAEADFERARAAFDNTLGGGRFAEPPPPAAPAPSKGSSRSEPSDRASGAAPKARAEKKADENPCANVCRAFSSLERSASAVCRLDGDGGERCARARGIVGDAEMRVKSCACKRP